ncbi:MAG: SDR family oxidoreductase [Actinobacteria bacterium]|nr:SDR family oxidoreductase [Actinomycetota bacterium]
MADTILFTGFPGFLGSELLPRVLARSTDATAICLVQAKFAGLARERADELVARDPTLAGRIDIVEGDIVQPDLGLGDAYDGVARTTTEIFHLAAVYDLSVPRALAESVNVHGTIHVLDLAGACDRLARLQYVSTCYVSGRYTGVFRETDLVKGQRFNNFYEETKYLAEVEVQARMAAGLPATIYRPSVVSGDSGTGATQKLDGPYFLLRWLLKQPRVAVMPMVGDPDGYRFNTVPRDFIVDAITELSARDDTVGEVYALADPEPLTVGQLVELSAEVSGKRLVQVPLPLGLAKFAIERIPGVFPLLEIPADAVDYFTHPTHYLTDNAQAALAGTGIGLPDKREWFRQLASFTRDHLGMSSAAMV